MATKSRRWKITPNPFILSFRQPVDEKFLERFLDDKYSPETLGAARWENMPDEINIRDIDPDKLPVCYLTQPSRSQTSKKMAPDTSTDTVKTVKVTKLQRPCFHIKAIEKEDGFYVQGNRCWSAVSFTTPEYTDIVGKYDRIRVCLEDNPTEIWEFEGATIMMAPGLNKDKCVLTYDNVCRIS